MSLTVLKLAGNKNIEPLSSVIPSLIKKKDISSLKYCTVYGLVARRTNGRDTEYPSVEQLARFTFTVLIHDTWYMDLSVLIVLR